MLNSVLYYYFIWIVYIYFQIIPGHEIESSTCFFFKFMKIFVDQPPNKVMHFNVTNFNTFFSSFKVTNEKPNVYSFDVLGDKVQDNRNSEWRKLGELITRYLRENFKQAVLVSTVSIDYLTSDSNRHLTPPDDCSASFEHEGRNYIVTAINQTQLEQILPDIMETEEFVFGLNVWLFFFEQKTSLSQLLHDENFRNEIKLLISNLNAFNELDLKYELIASVSNGCEMLWFNPSLDN